MSPAEAETPQGAVRRPGPLRVLVLDDEPDTVVTLLEIIRDEGHDAKGFSHPMEAFKALPDYDPDVVISDIAMPLMNGWDFARKVRQRMGEVRPLLIAITGVYQKPSEKLLATMAGYEFFLTKPCDPERVVELVNRARGAR
jgi:CheY-like chemotaxis protein